MDSGHDTKRLKTSVTENTTGTKRREILFVEIETQNYC